MVEVGQVISGVLFAEPMRVLTVQTNGPGNWTIGAVGLKSGQFRSVDLTQQDLEHLAITFPNFSGDGLLLCLGLQACSLRSGQRFAPDSHMASFHGDLLSQAVSRVLLRATEARFMREATELVLQRPLLSTALPHMLDSGAPTAEKDKPSEITPPYPAFEALQRLVLDQAQEPFACGACFYSLDRSTPARLDFYRPQVVDGTGQLIEEQLFTVEMGLEHEPSLRKIEVLRNMMSGNPPVPLPELGTLPKPDGWLHLHIFQPFLEEVRKRRLAEVERMTREGKTRPGEELDRLRALTAQSVERIATALVLPHPERESPAMQAFKVDPDVRSIAMQVVTNHERAAGRQVDETDGCTGFDLATLDLDSGELRLIAVKGLAEATGRILLTPNERRVAEDCRNCYWLCIVTDCKSAPRLQEPVRDPARFAWREIKKAGRYYLSVLRGRIIEFVGEDTCGISRGR